MTEGRPTPGRDRLAFGVLLCVLAINPARAGGEADFDVLHVNERYAQPVTVVAADTGTSAISYTVRGPTGIFAVDLEPLPARLKSLTLLLADLSRLESVSLTTPDGEYVELHALGVAAPDGIEVAAVDRGFRVRFTGAGLARLAPGGRLQIVDAWR